MSMRGSRRVECVGAVITDAEGRMLLIRRRNEPSAGLWSLPGGRLEPGESDQQAVVREVREETGLAGAVLDIRDYVAVVTGGELAAGDDAADARWAAPGEVAAMDAAGQLTGGLVTALKSWHVL
jgi:8-oxo-dGTP diphosphatase